MIQTINISLIPSDNKPVINVSQFDNVSRVLRFNVFDDVEMTVPHVFDNTETVLLNIRKNDNNIVVITGVIVSDIDPETQEVTDQYLTFELTEQACACVGSNFGELSITSGDDEVIGSCNFKLIVERSPLAGGISSQTAIDNLTTQIEQITEEVIGENYYTKTETDNLLANKADSDDVYTKTETDNLLSDKADSDDVYTKTETDNLLNDKANASSVYTKTETDNLLNNKADASNVYTKTETDNKIAALIDDAATVNDKTWSSDKIMQEIINILPTDTVSGDIATFKTSLQIPLLNANISLPISVNGISNILLTKYTGINVWDEEWELGAYSNTTGEPVERNDRIRTKNPIRVKPSSTYYLKYYNTSLVVIRYNSNDEFLYISSMNDSGLVTTNGDTRYIRFYLVANTYNNNISLNYPSSDTDYHAFNGTTQLISFTNPIYDGADVNLLTGDITIKSMIISIT